ncbi:ADP-ribose-binding protein [Acidianus sp. RZ1]|uniref:ADP-ribose-binding protein n=1 Tax=Acidianus sp. RZ1 TaxID=1540082 RepID=UPI001491514E|nr:ADP-ribose-binding protein [Acidianus sp. RZ1]NON61633.1 ADP-ribose-binding protein [Acidianus sp. RZ1]
MKVYKTPSLLVELIQGDLTEVEADALVNAANSYLKHGGGVAYSIVRKGGYEIQKESDDYVKRFGPVPVGEVAVTRAGRLKAKFIIHAVGPRYGMEGDDKLESAIRRSLEKADELNLTSISFPAISTGIYGYPYDVCARIMGNTIKEYRPKTVKKVTVCLYTTEAYKVFEETFDKILVRLR